MIDKVTLVTPHVHTKLKTIIMGLAILYWLSPVDAMPFLPFDDIVVMVAGYLFYSSGADVAGGAE